MGEAVRRRLCRERRKRRKLAHFQAFAAKKGLLPARLVARSRLAPTSSNGEKPARFKT
ncbi:hypothetical protein LQ948_18325 [Jiella sp. MQZ9-1]|nr:hypothetical protein [Jiella flava]